MKFLLIVTLGALLVSCGKNPGADFNGNKRHTNLGRLSSSQTVTIVGKSENMEFELISKSFDKEAGVLHFENFTDEEVVNLLDEKELEIEISGLENLLYENFKVAEFKASLSNLAPVNESVIKLNSMDLKKIVSLGLSIHFEKITFLANGVEVTQKFSAELVSKKSGSFDDLDSVRDIGAQRFVERFFVTEKTPVYEKYSKVGVSTKLDIAVPIMGAKAKKDYVTVTFEKFVGFEDKESDLDFSSYFQVSSVQEVHKDYRVKTGLKELRYEDLYSSKLKETQELKISFNKKLKNGHYVEFSDGTSTFLADSKKVEYLEDYKVKREIIPLYY